jgi:hypothetical protein
MKIELDPVNCIELDGRGKPRRVHWPRGVFRFKRGQYVWVRDRGVSKEPGSFKACGYRIVEARVRERHYHPGRHPFYPKGEGYSLNGNLWWDCYPGCRVFATRAEAIAVRLSKITATAF